MLLVKRIALAAVAACGCVPAGASAGTFTTLYTFSGSRDGGNPYGPLTLHGEALYGTTPAENSGNGNVFKVNTATGALKVVYAFKGGNDGADPTSGVAYQDGMLYGTTWFGGGSNCNYGGGCGTVFSINVKTGAEVVLHSFSNGANLPPAGAGSLMYVEGVLYGFTNDQGANNYGSLFSTNPATGAFTTLYSFGGGADGAVPNAQFLYENGLFYGTTPFGGGGPCPAGGGLPAGCGTVFSINPATGAEAVLHAFSTFADGQHPGSNLISYAGSLQGDTYSGGMKPPCRGGCGVNFAIDASTGAETILDIFANRKQDYSALSLQGETIYETHPIAGGHGELIKVNLQTGKRTVLHEFTGGADGGDPTAAIIYHHGVIYGSTLRGGKAGGCVGRAGCGTVFKYVP